MQHPGKGIDLRERRIWKMFHDKANLEVSVVYLHCSYQLPVCAQVSTLTPSDVTLFPDHDWLLGNHSDELTPWIPVMAARSSYRTRYFVLPCCPHDFESKVKDLKYVCGGAEVAGSQEVYIVPSIDKVSYRGSGALCCVQL